MTTDSQYRFKIFEKVNSSEWDLNLKKSRYSTFFQSTKYFKTHDNTKIPLYIYVYNEKDQIVGQLALIIIKKQKFYSTPKFQWLSNLVSNLGNRGSWVSGPIIHSDEQKQRIKILEIFLKSLYEIMRKYNLILLDGYSPAEGDIDEEYIKTFEKNNFNIERFVTFRADLTKKIEEIWKNVEKNAKNDVTKAERQNVVIREIKNKEELSEYLLLSKKWAKTKGIEISNPLENVDDDWHDYQAGLQKFFVAYQNREIISGLRIVTFNDIAYTHEVLNSYSKAASVGGPALTWYAIKWAKENGLRVYDFSGVKINSEEQQTTGLEKYKKKWGGTEFPYYHFIKVVNSKKYKIMRLLTRPDWYYRDYKRRHFKRPRK